MDIKPQHIKDVILFTPKVYSDERGFFLETFRKTVFEKLCIPEFVQHNHSRSGLGVLRGLHYQTNNVQGKLVRCTRGKIYDVAVDLRIKSNTFGKYVGVYLDDIKHQQLWIPPGFAHGFLCLSDKVDIHYLCTNFYDQKSENGIIWNDPNLNINWPSLHNRSFILSKKDQSFSKLNDQSQKKLF